MGARSQKEGIDIGGEPRAWVQYDMIQYHLGAGEKGFMGRGC